MVKKNKEYCTTSIVAGSSIFDKELFKNAVIEEADYTIGIDTFDKDALAYCLTRTINGSTEVLLSKVMHDKIKFTQECENIANYFNANIIKAE